MIMDDESVCVVAAALLFDVVPAGFYERWEHIFGEAADNLWGVADHLRSSESTASSSLPPADSPAWRRQPHSPQTSMRRCPLDLSG